MSDGQEPTATTESGQEPGAAPTTEPNGNGNGNGEPKVYDEAYVKALREEAAGNRVQLRELQNQLKEFQDQGKSDLEKLVEERDTLRSELEPTKIENLRLRVAIDKKLPMEMVDRLRGSNKEELEADADELLKLVRPPVEPEDLDGGARQPTTGKGGMNDAIRRAAGRA